jgi:hypothetical protein
MTPGGQTIAAHQVMPECAPTLRPGSLYIERLFNRFSRTTWVKN